MEERPEHQDVRPELDEGASEHPQGAKERLLVPGLQVPENQLIEEIAKARQVQHGAKLIGLTPPGHRRCNCLWRDCVIRSDHAVARGLSHEEVVCGRLQFHWWPPGVWV